MYLFLLYLGKMILCSGVLYGYYYAFLRNKSFHHYNRFYLLIITLISLVFPLFRVPIDFTNSAEAPTLFYRTLEVIVVAGGEKEPDFWNSLIWSEVFSLQNLVLAAYCLIALVSLIVFFRSLRVIRKITHKYQPEQIQEIRLYQTSEPGTPFSFFRNIFWNNKFELNSDHGGQLFRHELYHVKQKHSIDMVCLRIITSLFWVNPFFLLIRRELHAIHEFLADQFASSGSNRYEYAEILVLHAINQKKQPPSFVHSFFSSPIKRRIAMILKPSNNRFSYLRRIMCLPLLIFLFCSLALKAQHTVQELAPLNTSESLSKIFFSPLAGLNATNTVSDQGIFFHQTGAASLLSETPFIVVVDAGHGGTDPGAQANGLVEKNITLAISQKIAALAKAYGITVVTTRNNDKNFPLNERTGIAENEKANLLLSIHTGSAPEVKDANGNKQPNITSGAEFFISRKNNTFEKENVRLGSILMQETYPLLPAEKILKKREAGVWVLDKAPCPAVLIECGFISSKKDAAFLSDEDNITRLAHSILKGLVAYRDEAEIKVIPVKGPNPNAAHFMLQDSALKSFTRHMNRTLRFPPAPSDRHYEGTVFFKANLYADGGIKNWQRVEELPAGISAKEIVIVGFQPSHGASLPPIKNQPEKLREAVTKSVENYAKYNSSATDKHSLVYFKFTFKVEGGETTVQSKTPPQLVKADPTAVFKVAEIMPEFIGGTSEWLRFLNQNLKYPQLAIESNKDGKVEVQFIVNKDGSIENATLLNDPGYGLGDEALRVMKLSTFKWKPAIQNGHEVKAYKIQPITFRLEPQ